MTILCGTDFSRPAFRAADVAAALAKKFEDDLLLLHCITPAHRAATDPAMFSMLLEHWSDRLAGEVQRLASLGVTIATELSEETSPDELLARRSREKDARLIVVSSVGHRSPLRWRLGGVSERTAESAPVPTLVLREPEPLLRWARGEQPLKIFVAYDFSAPADTALTWAKNFSRLGNCEVTVAYVDWPPEEMTRLAIHEPTAPTANSAPIQEILEAQLRRRVDRVFGDSARIMVQGNWGRPDAALIAMARQAGSDLIVTGTHQHHGVSRVWHGSLSRNLLEFAPQSVVCVPAAPLAAVPAVSPRKILAATDFSPAGNTAILQAGALLPPGGCLKIVHVITPAERAGLAGDFIRDKPTLVDTVMDRLRAAMPPDASTRGIVTLADVLEDSDASRAIAAAAERFDADLIAVGTSGSSHRFHSVSRSLLRLSHRPVVIVPVRKP